MPWRDYDFFVYIAASRSHQLYIGFTNSLRRRMAEHREHRPGAYTARYNIDRLVFYEHPSVRPERNRSRERPEGLEP